MGFAQAQTGPKALAVAALEKKGLAARDLDGGLLIGSALTGPGVQGFAEAMPSSPFAAMGSLAEQGCLEPRRPGSVQGAVGTLLLSRMTERAEG